MVFTKGEILLFVLFISCIRQSTCKNSTRPSAITLAARTHAAQYEEYKYETDDFLAEEGKTNKRLAPKLNPDIRNENNEEYQIYQGVLGKPGIDFPVLKSIPKTNFNCRGMGNGYFADLSTNCQVFHICESGRKISFLCPNGTIFRQSDSICEWWFNVECLSATGSNQARDSVTSTDEKQKTSAKTNHIHNKPIIILPTPTEINRRMDLISTDELDDFGEIGVRNGKNQKFDKIKFSVNSQSGYKSYPHGSKEIQDTAESASFAKNSNSLNKYGYIPAAKPEKFSSAYSDPQPFTMRPTTIARSSTYSVTTSPVISNRRGSTTYHNSLKTDRKLNINNENNNNPHKSEPTPPSNKFQTARKLNIKTKDTPFYTPTIPTVTFQQPTQTTKSVSRTLTTTPASPRIKHSSIKVSDHAIEMIKTLEDLSLDSSITAQTERILGIRPGLEVPPSSGPNALHSLALYFATMDQVQKNNSYDNYTVATESPLTTQIQDRIDFVSEEELGISAAHLSQRTVKNYEALFESKKADKPEPPISDYQSSIGNFANDLEGEFSRHPILATAGSPQIRELAQVFTHALSAYLQDPNTFRRILSEIRPTEPPTPSINLNEIEYRSGRADNLDKQESSYAHQLTTANPSTTTEDFEVLDFSDVTVPSPKKGTFNYETTTPTWTTENPIETTTYVYSEYQTEPSQVLNNNNNFIDKTPGSRILTEQLERSAKKFLTTKQVKKITLNRLKNNPIAMEVNGGLVSSTIYPENFDDTFSFGSRSPKKQQHYKPYGFDVEYETGTPITNNYSTSRFGKALTTTSAPLSATGTIYPELQPPFELQNNEIETPSKFFEPPIAFNLNETESDEQLVHAQSQSFVASKQNSYQESERGRKTYYDYKTFLEDANIGTELPQAFVTTSTFTPKKGNKGSIKGHYITKKVEFASDNFDSTIAPDASRTTLPDRSNLPTTQSYTVFLDPLTINDGLMGSYEESTVTPSPHTYLPKNTTDASNLSTIIPTVTKRKGKQLNFPATIATPSQNGVADDDLDPMQEKANQMFGGLNETQADHLMNVMKKADSNKTVRRLILLLIQTCDDDFNKTVEESRKALLNALIGMDDSIQNEVKVIDTRNYRKERKLKENSFLPVTTYRSASHNRFITSVENTPLPVNIDYASQTEYTTTEDYRFLDEEESNNSPSFNFNNLDSYSFTTENVATHPEYETTTEYQTESTTTEIINITPATTTQYYVQTTNEPTTTQLTREPTRKSQQRSKPSFAGVNRIQKSLGTSGEYLAESNKNSAENRTTDARALELLRSLYSLASRWSG